MALTAAGSASAAFTPKLVVATDAASKTTIEYVQAATDDPAAALTYFVPFQYLPNFGFNSGDAAGTATAKVAAADVGGSTLALTGDIKAAAATDTIPGSTTTFGAGATSCTGGAGKVAFFVANLSGSGQTLAIPIYVDAVLAGGQYSETTGNILQICMPAPDLPSGTVGRAPFGAKLLDLSLVFNEVFSPPPGWYLWHLKATPYTPSTGRANAAGAVEAEAEDRTPQEVTVSGRVDRKTKAVVATGQVTEGGKGVSGVAVSILAGKKKVAATKSGPGGRFKATLKAKARSISATATAAERKLPACAGAILAPLPCVGGSVAGFTAKSDVVAVKGT